MSIVQEESRSNSQMSRSKSPSSGSEEEGEGEEYIVEAIVDKRNRKGEIQYLLKWKGFGPKHNTWQTADTLDGCPDLLEEFERKWEEENKKKQKNSSSSAGKKGSTSRKSGGGGSSSKATSQNGNGKAAAKNSSNKKRSISGSGPRSETSSVMEVDLTEDEDETEALDSDAASAPKRAKRTNSSVKTEPESDDDDVDAEAIPVSKKILDEGSFTDMSISARGGVEIRCHKLFLRASSAILREMLEEKKDSSNCLLLDNIIEGGEDEPATEVIDMTDISEDGVRAFLRYLYYNDLKGPREDVQVAFELLYAACKFQVPRLEERMIKCLLKKKTEDWTVRQAFPIYTLVRKMQEADGDATVAARASALRLKEKTVRILKANIDELESLPDYKELFEKCPQAAMELSKDLVKASMI